MDGLSQSDIARTSLEINGVAIPLGGAVSWGFTSGVQPQVARVTLLEGYTEKVLTALKKNKTREASLSLAIKGDGKDIRRTFHGLAIMPLEAGDYAHKTLILKDHRWWWGREVVNRSFNVVRRSTDFAIKGGQTSGGKAPRLVDFPRLFVDYTMQGYRGPGQSGYSRRPWTALEIAKFILGNVLGYTGKRIDTSRARQNDYVPSNVVAEGEPADSMLARMLKMSGNSLYIDNTGTIVIYQSDRPMNLAEWEGYIGDLGDPISGRIEVMDRKNVRPKVAFINHIREDEILLSYREKSAATIAAQSAAAQASPTGQKKDTKVPATTSDEAISQIQNRQVFMENVTRTVIDDQVHGVPRGSFVTIEDALEHFGTEYGSGPITLERFRKTYGPGSIKVFFPELGKDGQATILTDPLAMQIWGSIQRDYRSLFRIPSVVIERIKAIRPFLADVIFDETQTRLPSPVFTRMQYVIQTQIRISGTRPLVSPLDSFVDENGATRSKYLPVAADLNIVDSELGIVQFGPRAPFENPFVLSQVIRGQLDGVSQAAMGEDLFADNGILTDPNLCLSGSFGMLGDWEMHATVSAVLRAGAGGIGATGVPVDDERVSDLTGSVGHGPSISRISHADTARHRLPQAQFAAFNAGDGGGSNMVNQKLIDAIASQEAILLYYDYVDQAQGSAEYELSEASSLLRPGFHIGEIRWTVQPNGSHRVNLLVPKRAPKPNFDNLLSARDRQALGREISRAPSIMRGDG